MKSFKKYQILIVKNNRHWDIFIPDYNHWLVFALRPLLYLLPSPPS